MDINLINNIVNNFSSILVYIPNNKRNMAQLNGQVVPAPLPLDVNEATTVIRNLKLFKIKTKFSLYLLAIGMDEEPN